MPGENDFDMSGAVAEISDGLGLGDDTGGGDADLNLGTGSTAGADPAAAADGSGAGVGDGNTGAARDPAAADSNAPPAGTFTPPETHKHLFNEQGMLRTWRGEAAAEFSKLPPVVQQEILKQ